MAVPARGTLRQAFSDRQDAALRRLAAEGDGRGRSVRHGEGMSQARDVPRRGVVYRLICAKRALMCCWDRALCTFSSSIFNTAASFGLCDRINPYFSGVSLTRSPKLRSTTLY